MKEWTYRFATSRTDFSSTPLGFCSIGDLGRISIGLCHDTTRGHVGLCLMIHMGFHWLQSKKKKCWIRLLLWVSGIGWFSDEFQAKIYHGVKIFRLLNVASWKARIRRDSSSTCHRKLYIILLKLQSQNCVRVYLRRCNSSQWALSFASKRKFHSDRKCSKKVSFFTKNFSIQKDGFFPSNRNVCFDLT